MATIDLGKIKLVWRGTYNNGTAYTVDDVVEYTDTGITSAYICVANSTGNAPSSSGTAHASWNYMTKGVADPIPSQSGNSGKYLTSNGSTASWGTVASVGQAHNLVINGAFLIAQRGVSSSSEGFQTVDRFDTTQGGVDEGPTREQADVAAGTTPYTLGFRKCFKITNGNQTGGAGTSDHLLLSTKLEAQDIANSGWNYLSTSSYITLSFWVKSSVAQNFYFRVQATDGTVYSYVMETGSLTADTWTKITKTISGNSNLTFNNDNGEGLLIRWALFRGTDNTGTRPLNAWAAYDGSTRYPDNTSTWYTTNDATFEITGVQLEVGDTANDFAHESYGQALARCQRYYIKTDQAVWNNVVYATHYFPTTMRTSPTIGSSSSGADQTRPNCWYGKHNSGGINGGVSFNWTASAEL